MGTAIYLRQSQDKSGQWAAIARQEEACKKHAGAKGLDGLSFYRDNDRSASNGQDRPEFTRLLADIRAGPPRRHPGWTRRRADRVAP